MAIYGGKKICRDIIIINPLIGNLVRKLLRYRNRLLSGSTVMEQCEFDSRPKRQNSNINPKYNTTMVINFSNMVYVPTTVQVGWNAFGEFQPLTEFSPTNIENGYGIMSTSVIETSAFSLYGQPLIFRFDGWEGYSDPTPGPGLYATIDLSRVTATKGEIQDLFFATKWVPVPESSLSFILIFALLFLTKRKK